MSSHYNWNNVCFKVSPPALPHPFPNTQSSGLWWGWCLREQLICCLKLMILRPVFDKPTWKLAALFIALSTKREVNAKIVTSDLKILVLYVSNFSMITRSTGRCWSKKRQWTRQPRRSPSMDRHRKWWMPRIRAPRPCNEHPAGRRLHLASVAAPSPSEHRRRTVWRPRWRVSPPPLLDDAHILLTCYPFCFCPLSSWSKKN